ncbi:hypothetical protein [Rhabdothermincola salaria]|uniref:hypothetical protein n=1 Tax=Rhabdothermincola salaria TaxID=2903142 RepID=UPI001E32C5C2|nr:hypothetical protein [Rhabdothermincola salaria]MCD9625262.1 hypothetical protein [Rhabdothermincola salaria]
MDGSSYIRLKEPQLRDAALPSTCETAGTSAGAVSSRLASASLIPLVALLAGSLTAVWLSVRTGSSTSRFAGLEVPILRYVLLALVACALLGVLIEGLVLDRWPLAVPAIAGSVVLVLAALLLILEEVAASLIPTSFLPTSVRRLTVDVYGGLGIWMAAFASLALVVTSRIDGGAIGVAHKVWMGVQRLPLRWLAAFILVGVSVCVAAWSRYQPWAAGSAGIERIEVPGWSLPFVGPGSLIAVVALGAAAVVLTVQRNLVAALVLVVSGWALSFLAALALLATSTLARVKVNQYLPSTVERYGPSVEVRWGAWLMFATGCVAAACGMAIVYWSEREIR